MKRFIGMVLVLILAGCGKVSLYSGLSERDANEMLALLLSAQLDASKEWGDDKAWAVHTGKSDLPRAVEILHDAGYPRERYQSLGDIFKKEGFVSSPVEERARFQHGQQQELARTVSLIDGVVDARVHLSLPAKDALSERVDPPSAAVFVKHRASAKTQENLADIEAILMNSVEGLTKDRITVSFFAAQPWVGVPKEHDATQSQRATSAIQPLAYGAGGVALALAVGGIGWIGLRRRVPDPGTPLGAIVARLKPRNAQSDAD